jgi:hypothetical protein
MAEVALIVVVGVPDRESLTAEEARLLLHDAADALASNDGPLLHIWAPEADPDE